MVNLFIKLNIFSSLYFSAPIPTPPKPPTDFPRPDIIVNCLADGVKVTVDVVDPNFHGVMYVKGHSNDRNCLRTVEQGEAAEPLDFSVKFDTCGLFHSDVSYPSHNTTFNDSPFEKNERTQLDFFCKVLVRVVKNEVSSYLHQVALCIALA